MTRIDQKVSIKIEFNTILIGLLFILNLIDSNLLYPAHVRGGELTWKCLNSGNDSGKVVFELKFYALCTGSTSNSYTLINPLYNLFGGVTSIPLLLLPGANGTIDLSPSCYDSSLQKNCFDPNENPDLYYQKIYRSAPVNLIGVPSVSGSDFVLSLAGFPSQTMNGINLGSTYFSAKMFPHINPLSGAPDTLGTANNPSCYDSSPIFPENVPFLGFLGVTNNHSNLAFDQDSDPIVYSFDSVLRNHVANLYVQYNPGYSGLNPFPNTLHHSMNVPLSLDSISGNFSFTPIAPSGMFLVNQKATSYRNGQRIAEVYRLYIMLLDSLPNDRYNQNNNPPVLSFKKPTDPVHSSTFADTFFLGQNIIINVKAEDNDSLNPFALQSVSVRLIPDVHTFNPLDSANCQFNSCAYLDTVNPSWNGDIHVDTSVVLADLKWNLTCELLDNLNPVSVSGIYKTYQFSFIAKDNICPFPLTAISRISITVADSSGLRIKRIRAQGDDNLISWPVYNAPAVFSAFNVLRSNSIAGPFSLLHTSFSQSDTSYLDTSSLATQTPYFYKVSADDSLGCNPLGGVVRSLHLDASRLGMNVKLLWNDLRLFQPVLNKGVYEVYSDTGTGWIYRTSLPFGSVTWTDTEVGCGKFAYYYIRAVDQSNKVELISNIDSSFVSLYTKFDLIICPGDSILILGTYVKTPGSYFDTIPGTVNCIRVRERVLVIDSIHQTAELHEVCQGDSIMIDNIWRSVAGIYPETLNNVNGCDSIVNHEIVIKPSYTNTNNKIICKGSTYFDVVFGQSFSNEGLYTKYFSTDQHCDSNYVLNLSFRQIDLDLSLSYGPLILSVQQSGATYQWIDCVTRADIPGATAQTFTPAVDGIYAVRVTYMGCTEESECREVMGVGIKDNAGSMIKLFPNPATASIYIQTVLNFHVKQLIIRDITGKEIKSKFTTQKPGLLEVDLSEFGPGLYFLELTEMNDSKSLFRFVKE